MIYLHLLLSKYKHAVLYKPEEQRFYHEVTKCCEWIGMEIDQWQKPYNTQCDCRQKITHVVSIPCVERHTNCFLKKIASSKLSLPESLKGVVYVHLCTYAFVTSGNIMAPCISRAISYIPSTKISWVFVAIAATNDDLSSIIRVIEI